MATSGDDKTWGYGQMLAASWLVGLTIIGCLLYAMANPDELQQVNAIPDASESDSNVIESPAAFERRPLQDLVPGRDSLLTWTAKSEAFRPNDPSPWLDPSSACAAEAEFVMIDTMENVVRTWESTATQSSSTYPDQIYTRSHLEIHVAYADDAAHAKQVASWFGPFADRCVAEVIGGDLPIVGQIHNGGDTLHGSAYVYLDIYNPETNEFWGKRITGFYAVDDMIFGIDLAVEVLAPETNPAILAELMPEIALENVILAGIATHLEELGDA